MKIIANLATIGKYKTKVINSLVHGGAYVAIHIKKRRIAWYSFKTKKITSYDGTAQQDLNEIDEVYAWFDIKENYNKAVTMWNNFYNGVTVPLKED